MPLFLMQSSTSAHHFDFVHFVQFLLKLSNDAEWEAEENFAFGKSHHLFEPK